MAEFENYSRPHGPEEHREFLTKLYAKLSEVSEFLVDEAPCTKSLVQGCILIEGFAERCHLAGLAGLEYLQDRQALEERTFKGLGFVVGRSEPQE